MADLQLHIQALLGRFTNAALGDTCQRVGGDPTRKLGADDRLIGSAKLALEQGITPAYIAVGAAAAIHRYLKENEKTQTVENAVLVLQEVSGLQAEETLAKMILDCYGKLIGGATIRELCALADTAKAQSLKGII